MRRLRYFASTPGSGEEQGVKLECPPKVVALEEQEAPVFARQGQEAGVGYGGSQIRHNPAWEHRRGHCGVFGDGLPECGVALYPDHSQSPPMGRSKFTATAPAPKTGPPAAAGVTAEPT